MGDTNWVKNFTPNADGDAEWAAGMRYLFDDANEGVQDFSRAVECFMRGVAVGNRLCLLQMASCYEGGHGVPQDFAKARELRARASELQVENQSKTRKGGM